MWDAFATAWDEIVADLREADLLSNAEAVALRFVRLNYGRGLELSGVRPILLPAFFYAGQIQKARAWLLSRRHLRPSPLFAVSTAAPSLRKPSSDAPLPPLPSNPALNPELPH